MTQELNFCKYLVYYICCYINVSDKKERWVLKKIIIIISILLISFFVSYQAFSEIRKTKIAADKAVILFMEGDAKIKERDAKEWKAAKGGTILSSGDRLMVEPKSWVELGLGNNYPNIVRVQQMTVVEFTSLKPVEMNLLYGELRILVEKLDKKETFDIKTPVSVCGVRGTGWDTNTDGKMAYVDVFENDIYFSNLSKANRTNIEAGKRGIILDPTKPIIIKDVPRGRMLDWEAWKEGLIKRRKGARRAPKEKALGIEQGEKAVEAMIKGKQSMYEKSDKEKMGDRYEAQED